MHQSPKRIADVIRTVYHADRLPEEHMFLLTFDVKLHLIGLFEISHGTHQESVANPSQIIQRVLLCGASVFAIVHNHPSGDPTPSECDKKITERIYRSGEILGVKLLDHIVIGDQKYVSFREQGMLPV